MHPDFLRELGSQRDSEMRARAHHASLVRMASKALRAARQARRAAEEADALIVPAIPDYVDGSFRAAPAADHAADVPAGRTAA
jgi:hypothetical protein